MADLCAVFGSDEILIECDDISESGGRQIDGFKVLDDFIAEVELVRRVLCRDEDYVVEIDLLECFVIVIVAHEKQTSQKFSDLGLLLEQIDAFDDEYQFFAIAGTQVFLFAGTYHNFRFAVEQVVEILDWH